MIPGDLGANIRGPFTRDHGRPFAAISDGTSNTIFFSEMLISGGNDQLSVKRVVAAGGSGADGTPNWCLTAIDPTNRNQIKSSDGWWGANYTGRRWADGAEMAYAHFYTIMAPNTISCILWGGDLRNASILTASSNHPGGVNASLADGSVRFASDTVDTGSSSTAAWGAFSGSSPYGVWGAMGTIDGGESKFL